jgi:DNA mismatch endonuclease (patch repair protein)
MPTLLFSGGTVIRFWGKDIMKHTDECVKVVKETIFDVTVGIDIRRKGYYGLRRT